MLPPSVVDDIRHSKRLNRTSAERKAASVLAWSFDCVHLMQSDIVGFTKLGSRVSPEALCGMLHNLFSDFDEMCDEFLVYKIETIVSPARFFPSFFPLCFGPAVRGCVL